VINAKGRLGNRRECWANIFFAHIARQIQAVPNHRVAQKRALEDILRLLLANGDQAE